MKRSTKLMYRGAPKSLRRQLHELDKNKNREKFKMDHIVSRPANVPNKDGVLVPYEGP